MIRLTPVEAFGPLNSTEAWNVPRHLYLQGDLSLLTQGRRVSIIGSRRASVAGIRRTISLSKLLVEQGIIVVSGLAEGIDTAAHATAMKYEGRTVAVIGTSLDESYPRGNRAIQQRIASEHLLVSQFPFHSRISRSNFPLRNRTMALISDATVIVEAQEGSGCLYQAWETLRLGKPLFIMESNFCDDSLKWPHELLAYGAQVLTRSNFDYLIDCLPQGTREEMARIEI